jgi:hypothetical protein
MEKTQTKTDQRMVKYNRQLSKNKVVVNIPQTGVKTI